MCLIGRIALREFGSPLQAAVCYLIEPGDNHGRMNSPLTDAPLPRFCEERSTQVEGLATFSRSMGLGEEVVLIHGAGVSSRYWVPAQRWLAELGPFRVHAPDLPGFGRSENPPWPPELPLLARHLEGWLAQNVPGRFHVVGQSVGCEIAVLLAAAMPDRVQSVVLAGPAGLPSLHSVWGQIFRAGLDVWRERWELFPAILPDYLRCGSWRLLRILQEQKHCHVEPLLPHLRQPVLILRGQYDTVAPDRRVKRIAALLPDATITTIPGAHGAHYTHARAFAEVVTQYLHQVGSPTPPAGTPVSIPAPLRPAISPSGVGRTPPLGG